MNLPTVHNGETGGKAGAVDLGGSAHAAPANFTVGHVGFGPCWEDDEVCLTDKGWKTITDSMAASIIRLEQELAEAKATIESLRDQLCADKCRDKAAADGGWANI
jgi:hypothetical protein